jgi:hypothetical protein
LRHRYGRAAWSNLDWMILRSIAHHHTLTPKARARAFQLAGDGFIDVRTGRLTVKGQHALVTERVE